MGVKCGKWRVQPVVHSEVCTMERNVKWKVAEGSVDSGDRGVECGECTGQ